MEELGRHRDDAFAVGLRWRDDQQGDDLAVRPLVLANAQVGEFAELFDAHAGVPQGLDGGPFPEHSFLVGADMDGPSALDLLDARGDRVTVAEELAV